MRGTFISALLLGAVCVTPVQALPGKAHCSDALAALGEPPSSRLAPLAELVSKEMDSDCSELLQEINAPMVAAGCFTWAGYSHRIFFHWGFNQSPRSLSALAQQVQRAVEEQNLMVHLEQQQGADITRSCITEEAVWRIIEKEWNKRRSRILGKASRFAHGEALAVIMYDVHLLGDYSTRAVDALPELRVVARELNDAIRTLGKGNPGATARLTQRIGELARRAHSRRRQSKTAALILELVKKELPGIVAPGRRAA